MFLSVSASTAREMSCTQMWQYPGVLCNMPREFFSNFCCVRASFTIQTFSFGNSSTAQNTNSKGLKLVYMFYTFFSFFCGSNRYHTVEGAGLVLNSSQKHIECSHEWFLQFYSFQVMLTVTEREQKGGGKSLTNRLFHDSFMKPHWYRWGRQVV